MTLAAGVVARGELAGAWTFDPVLLAGLAVTAVIYARGTARLRRRITGPGMTTLRGRRALAFYGALLLLAAALISPLDALSSALFSAHMVQHLLLMVVVAPLLVIARPAPALLNGLPAGGRDAARQIAASSTLRGVARWAGRPVVVWAIGAIVLWAWHMPALYEAALANDALHVAEHASFLGAAILFWNVVLGRAARRGAGRPIAALLVFANGVQGTTLGAVLLFASHPLYPVHTEGTALWGTSPLADQQLAGALMWGPPALVYLLVIGWLLFRWFAEMEESSADPLLLKAGEAL